MSCLVFVLSSLYLYLPSTVCSLRLPAVLDVFHFLHISFGVHVFPVCPDLAVCDSPSDLSCPMLLFDLVRLLNGSI